MPVRTCRIRTFAFVLFIFSTFLHSLSAYDLSQVRLERLKNGLTVMILEDHTQPLVSTQVLYKVGGRNECVGATGLAHFVEHMAFRATTNFPDTQEAIYSVGGEWHGYTWIDQTTYFETVPVDRLNTVLRLQADRMTNVVNRKEEVEAERGAVLTELHGYENDPATVLYDKVLAVSFLEHPYRFNTIGWTSDVEKITHSDLVDFYRRFYNPANAVLAIAGDVNTESVLDEVGKHFGSMEGRPVDSIPRTVEPQQRGERRVNLYGTGKRSYYQISYRAPGAGDPDYAAFLLLQAILGGGHGVNFRQSGFSVDVAEGTRLAGIGGRITTMFVPTAQPYVFNIAGHTESDAADIEAEIEKRIAIIRKEAVSQKELIAASKQLLAELVFDIETTEDAAHQMAYFEGIGAFDVLLKLPESIAKVTPADIQRVAQRFLAPQQRTIGWYLGDGAPTVQSGATNLGARKDAAMTAGVAERLATPVLSRTGAGLPLIVQKIDRTPAAFLRVLIPSNSIEGKGAITANEPVWRYSSIHWRFLKEDLAKTIAKASEIIGDLRSGSAPDIESVESPEARLDLELSRLAGASTTSGRLQPALVAIAGDVDPGSTIQLLKRAFPNAPGRLEPSRLKFREKMRTVRLPGKAQSQFGYAILAPRPSASAAAAYRAVLYILTHGYGGRLGKELINNRGLIYYISSDYHSDGNASWISIRFGVNPDKLYRTKAEFEKIMHGLRVNPPTHKELAEAKQHLIGRRITAHQSNEELSGFYAREWIEQGRLITRAEFEKQINAVTMDQIKSILPEFLKGAQVIIDTNP